MFCHREREKSPVLFHDAEQTNWAALRGPRDAALAIPLSAVCKRTDARIQHVGKEVPRFVIHGS